MIFIFIFTISPSSLPFLDPYIVLIQIEDATKAEMMILNDEVIIISKMSDVKMI